MEYKYVIWLYDFNGNLIDDVKFYKRNQALEYIDTNEVYFYCVGLTPILEKIGFKK